MISLPRTKTASLPVCLAILAFLSGGCAAHPAAVHEAEPETAPAVSSPAGIEEDPFVLEGEFTVVSTEPVSDPFSVYNRVMTQVNDKIYFWLLKPVAQGYRAVVPEGARLAVGRFFRNLLMPVRFANNLLQLKPKKAGTELARFVVNTTVGVLGFGDPAANKFGLQAYPEDFGQTLGYYGVGSGFHIVLPLLGPSNLRDTLGLIPAYFLDPVSYIEETDVQLAVRAYDRVNYTSLHIGEYESLKKDAVDLYTFLRDGYEQRRIKQIEE